MLKPEKLAGYLRGHTIVGDIAFGPNGEWKDPRVMETRFQGVTSRDLDQFRESNTRIVLWPPASATGTICYPYTDARQ